MRGREYRVLVGAAKMADFERDFQEAAIALGAATLVAGTAAKIVEGGVTRRSSASPSVRLVVLDDNARSHAEKQEIVLEISELDGSPWTLPMHSGRAQKTLEVDLPKNITIKHRGKVERHSEWEYDGQVFRINTK
jgi:hypothetical protein